MATTYNEKLIEKYKDFDEIIKTTYLKQDKNGELINLNGIINPLKIDNRQICAPTDNQGKESSCTAYSIANICESIIWKKTGKLVNLDASQIYAKSKELDGSPNTDGTQLQYAIKAAFQLGGFGSSKIEIGYLTNDKTDRTIEQFKYLLHKYDFIHAGFMCYSGWYKCTNENYIINCTGTSLGGHAVIIPYYDKIGVGIQNSWGPQWGTKGFGLMTWEDFKRTFVYACYIKNIYDGI